MTVLDDGTYLQVDGRDALRFVRRYPHSVERVWRAITEPTELAHWFPSPDVRYEPRPEVGAIIHLEGDPYDEEPQSGTVLVWDPPHRFSFGWGNDELRIVLSADGDGCVLEFIDILESEGGASRNAAGWTMCIDDLDKLLSGTSVAGPRSGDEADFRTLLEQFKKRGFPDDGWLPEMP